MRIPPLLKTFLSVKTAFKRAVSLSKLEGKVSPLTLRHTAAIWLMQIGVSTWDAAGFLGMSEKTLRDVYGHHHPDYLQGAAKAIGAKKPVRWSYRWSNNTSAVRCLRNILKLLVGPGVVPRPCDFNNLQCHTFLTALTRAKDIFLRCQTGIVTIPT